MSQDEHQSAPVVQGQVFRFRGDLLAPSRISLRRSWHFGATVGPAGVVFPSRLRRGAPPRLGVAASACVKVHHLQAQQHHQVQQHEQAPVPRRKVVVRKRPPPPACTAAACSAVATCRKDGACLCQGHHFSRSCASDGCAICLDASMATCGAVQLPCLHVFHAACLSRWRRRASTCPICRTPLPDAEDEGDDEDDEQVIEEEVYEDENWEEDWTEEEDEAALLSYGMLNLDID